MIKKMTGRTRSDYMSLIYMYNTRAEKYPKGSKVRLRLKAKVSYFKRAIREYIHKRGMVYTVVNGKHFEMPKKLHDAEKFYKEYFGEEIRGCRISSDTHRFSNYTLSQKIFCKYAIEIGCKYRHVGLFIGSTSIKGANEIRRRFTKSFATNQKNKDAYHAFLRAAKQRQNEQ